MLIGLTYDLMDDYLAAGWSADDVAEFDSPAVVEALEGALRGLGHETDRIGHVGSLLSRLGRGDRWDLVFNVCEGLSAVGGVAREAQVPTILDLYGIPYTFSPPLPLALSLDKAMTKRVVRDLGVPTAGFVVVSSVEEALAIVAVVTARDAGPRGAKARDDGDRVRLGGGVKKLTLPLFVKPMAEGSSKGVTGRSIVRSWDDFVLACELLLVQFRQPVLVERYLPGRELTVGIVGTGDQARCLGALEIHLNEKAEAGLYSFDNKEHWQERMTFSLAEGALQEECFAVALAAYRGLGCRDAGRVDVRQDDQGRMNFIEINPLAGLHPVKSDLPILARMAGVEYQQLIGMIVESAMERVGRRPKTPPGLPGAR